MVSINIATIKDICNQKDSLGYVLRPYAIGLTNKNSIIVQGGLYNPSTGQSWPDGPFNALIKYDEFKWSCSSRDYSFLDDDEDFLFWINLY